MFTKIKFFIPIAVAITCICGLIYLIGQQDLRMDANQPQIQYAEDNVNSLNKNQIVLGQGQVPTDAINDIELTQNTFLITYDTNGKFITSTGEVDGKVPVPPSGVFSYAKAHGEDRITWEPKNGVRIAAIIKPFESAKTAGFVLVGRNIREVEKREDQLLMIVALGWVVTLLATFVATVIFVDNKNKK